MHRLPSYSAIYRLRIAALLLCAKCVLVPVTAGVIVYSLIVHDSGLAMIGLGFAVLTMLLVVYQWLVSSRTNCPLCMTPVLAAKECATHHHARTAFGSHRLRVALAIIFKNSFRCPYCHEPTVLAVRERRQ